MKNDTMKLLIITRNAWNNNISTGNTLTNFFSGFDGEIANIYCRNEKINNTICSKYYRISEHDLLNSILKNKKAGVPIYYENIDEIFNDNKDEKLIISHKKAYSFFRNHRLTFFLWFREVLWKLGRWKGTQLDSFLNDFSPNIIFMPIYDSPFMHNILHYVKKHTNAKVVLYTGDDNYTLKKWSISPLFWINKFFVRKKIKRSVNMSDLRMTLTDKQSDEYTRIFNKNFITVRKGQDFSGDCPKSKPITKPLDIVYTGNIGQGRYEILGLLAKAIDRVNAVEQHALLHIYTGNELTSEIKKYC